MKSIFLCCRRWQTIAIGTRTALDFNVCSVCLGEAECACANCASYGGRERPFRFHSGRAFQVAARRQWVALEYLVMPDHLDDVECSQLFENGVASDAFGTATVVRFQSPSDHHRTFVSLLQCLRVEQLHLDGYALQPQWNAIAEFTPNLQALDISPHLENDLSALCRCTKLRSLNLDVEQGTRSLALESILHLALCCPNFTDCPLGAFTSLVRLRLARGEFGNLSDAELYTVICGCSNLEEIDVE
jgi:hypothetical protein